MGFRLPESLGGLGRVLVPTRRAASGKGVSSFLQSAVRRGVGALGLFAALAHCGDQKIVQVFPDGGRPVPADARPSKPDAGADAQLPQPDAEADAVAPDAEILPDAALPRARCTQQGDCVVDVKGAFDTQAACEATCEPDGDGDGWRDSVDLCPDDPNLDVNGDGRPDNSNVDGDAAGDVCDPCPTVPGVVCGSPLDDPEAVLCNATADCAAPGSGAPGLACDIRFCADGVCRAIPREGDPACCHSDRECGVICEESLVWCEDDQCQTPAGLCTVPEEPRECETNADCDDGDPCTLESCDAGAGVCETDGVRAVPGECCRVDADCGGNPAFTGVCFDASNTCEAAEPECTVDADCSDDGNSCTTHECVRGNCDTDTLAVPDECCRTGTDCVGDEYSGVCLVAEAGGNRCEPAEPECTVAANCVDTDPCTIDGCGADDLCTHTLQSIPAECCRGDAECTLPVHTGVCTSSHVCEERDCTSGADCNDLDPCTDDECTRGTCDHDALTPGAECCSNNAQCAGDPGLTGTCVYPGQCGVREGRIIECTVDADCPDLDSNACTPSDCNANGFCEEGARDASCCLSSAECTGDGLTGRCVDNECEIGMNLCVTDAECNDGNACTIDDCFGAGGGVRGTCTHTQRPAADNCCEVAVGDPNCGDTIGESNVCRFDQTCVPGCTAANAAVTCNDLNACTADSCSSGNCVHTLTTPPAGRECCDAGADCTDVNHTGVCNISTGLCEQFDAGVMPCAVDADCTIDVDGDPCTRNDCAPSGVGGESTCQIGATVPDCCVIGVGDPVCRDGADEIGVCDTERHACVVAPEGLVPCLSDADCAAAAPAVCVTSECYGGAPASGVAGACLFDDRPVTACCDSTAECRAGGDPNDVCEAGTNTCIAIP